MQIIINHLGFRPEDKHKRAIIMGECERDIFQIIDLGVEGYNEKNANPKTNYVIYEGRIKEESYFGKSCYVADFSDFKTPGVYLITINNENNSVPFTIRDDIYSRTLKKAFNYIHIQRCGRAVEGYHEACHLDDAVEWESGEYINTTGGWHDAGDLRKWVIHTLLLGISIVKLKRLINPDWYAFDKDEGDLLNELRWGNKYFLKMQDKDGCIWHDVGGGLRGDNCDNRWTDNIKCSGDERHLNKKCLTIIQWRFIMFEIMVADLFKECDPEYSTTCYKAAIKTYKYIYQNENKHTNEATWAILALIELCSFSKAQNYTETQGINSEKDLTERLESEINNLLSLQEKDFKFEQSKIKGYWYSTSDKNDFYRWHEGSGGPIIALSEVCGFLDQKHPLRRKCIEAIKLYCRDYILPMTQTNPFRIVPFGLYENEPSDEKYRELEGNLKFRFFAPTKCGFYQGLTAHLLSHSVGMTMAGKLLEDNNLMDLARNQVEWVMGCNPENACLMTAEGINNPYPHSRFLGLIPGGIMNGFIGDENDKPFLDMRYTTDWRTTEYWSPHTCFYIWYVSLLNIKGGENK